MTARRMVVRLLAVVLVAAFGCTLCAQCAEAEITTSAQMACCKDGELTCAAHGSANDCCRTDAARPRAVVAGARIDPVHTLSAVVAWAVVPDMGIVDAAHTRTGPPPSRPHIEPGPPPYIAFSSLLI